MRKWLRRISKTWTAEPGNQRSKLPGVNRRDHRLFVSGDTVGLDPGESGNRAVREFPLALFLGTLALKPCNAGTFVVPEHALGASPAQRRADWAPANGSGRDGEFLVGLCRVLRSGREELEVGPNHQPD